MEIRNTYQQFNMFFPTNKRPRNAYWTLKIHVVQLHNRDLAGSPIKLGRIEDLCGFAVIIMNTGFLKKVVPVMAIQARTVVWFLMFSGVTVQYFFRFSVNIAIVDMVAMPRRTREHIGGTVCYASGNVSAGAQSKSNETIEVINIENKLQWDERQQAQVLGSLFWSVAVTTFPGGVMAQHVNTKGAFGIAQFLSSLLSLITPMAARYHLYAILTVRVIQGVISGLAASLFSTTIAKWVPPNDRSKFANVYGGAIFSPIITYLSGGFLIESFGWESLFYISGGIGIIWCMCWWCLFYNEPADHPRISFEERSMIEKSLSRNVNKQKMKTPWMAMLRSSALWTTCIGQAATTFSFFAVSSMTPTFFKFIHGQDVSTVGILSAIILIPQLVFSLLISAFIDHILKLKLLSQTNARKLAAGISTILPALFLVGAGMYACNFIVVFILIALTSMCIGALFAGTSAGSINIAPNFAGVIRGILVTFGITSGVTSIGLAGQLTHNNQTVEQWQKFYYICGGVAFVGGVQHLLFNSSEVQPWNAPPTAEKEELPLKKHSITT